jgi:hypothetical protein
VYSWATNKPREIVERDIDNAVRRLLAGERFEMHCSGPQISMVKRQLAAMADSHSTQG